MSILLDDFGSEVRNRDCEGPRRILSLEDKDAGLRLTGISVTARERARGGREPCFLVAGS
jgi:hypothetical protein